MLERIDPSPLHTMNRAVAVAESHGAEAGLALLQAVAPRHNERALASAPTEAVRDLLRRSVAALG